MSHVVLVPLAPDAVRAGVVKANSGPVVHPLR
jgi:hypothetical protein